jgi:hypothetical protein
MGDYERPKSAKVREHGPEHDANDKSIPNAVYTEILSIVVF